MQTSETLSEAEEFFTFFYELDEMADLQRNYLFKVLREFTRCVLSLPHSSANCERQFSKINLIKTKDRNRLITNTLNGILYSSQHVMHLQNGRVSFEPTDKMLRSKKDVTQSIQSKIHGGRSRRRRPYLE